MGKKNSWGIYYKTIDDGNVSQVRNSSLWKCCRCFFPFFFQSIAQWNAGVIILLLFSWCTWDLKGEAVMFLLPNVTKSGTISILSGTHNDYDIRGHCASHVWRAPSLGFWQSGEVFIKFLFLFLYIAVPLTVTLTSTLSRFSTVLWSWYPLSSGICLSFC